MVEKQKARNIGPQETAHEDSHPLAEGPSNQPDLSDDLLVGANAIAAFMFGDSRKRRQVYHLAQSGELPIFKLGAILCARKSRLLESIEKKEEQAY